MKIDMQSRGDRIRARVDDKLSDPASLLAMIATLAVLAVWIYRSTFGSVLSTSHEKWGQFGDFIGGVLNPFIGFFTLVALIATVQQNKKLVKASIDQTDLASAERRFDASKDALSSAITGIEAAVRHLQAARNDRVLWISAVRLLATAQRLRASITEPTHIDMLEIAVEQARRTVGELLGYDNTGRGGAFFYGAPLDPKSFPAINVDEAAKLSTKGKRPTSIPEQAIWEFWNFAQFPAGYADALAQSNPTWDIDHTPNAVMWPGVFEYLRHRREWISAAGNLVKRPPAE